MGISVAKKMTTSIPSEGNGYLDGALRITGILGIVPATALPLSSDTVMGVINFRGKTVPVLDLRVNFLPGDDNIAEQICILSAETNREDSPLIFGALVDSEDDAYALVTGNTH
ncbi:chemotaxis protein CheW [Thiovibrio sp. JS02]